MGFENGKLVRVVLAATLGDRQEVNTFHYDLDDGGGTQPNNPQTLADRFRDDVRPGWATMYRARWEIQPVEVVEEHDPLNPTAPRSSWTSGNPIAGTSSGSDDLLPSACCFVCTLRTAHIGRRFRGRNFIGGDNQEGGQSDGIWGSAQVAYLQGTVWHNVPFEPDIAGPGSDARADWCVYSRTQRAANLDPYASHVQSFQVRNVVHWRRARQGIG